MLLCLSLMLVAAHAQEAPPSADDTRPTTATSSELAAAETATVSVVYTGGQGGVGAGRYPFSALRHLQEQAVPLQSVSLSHGALVQGDWALWAPDRRVQSVLDFLAGEGIACGASVPVQALQTETDLTLLPAEDGVSAPLQDALESLQDIGGVEVARVLRRCTSSGGQEAILVGPSEGMPVWSLPRFAFRQVLQIAVEGGGEDTLTMLGIPLQDAARSVAHITAVLAARPGALFVDAGDFVDGASAVRDGSLSLHRPLGFEILARLQPTALAPGPNELIGGPRHLLAEAAAHGLTYTAANWQAADPALALPPFLLREVPLPDNASAERPLRIAFVGMLDPRLNVLIPELRAEGVTITDPIPAVQAVVDHLYAREDAPDAVVLLSVAGGDVLELARRRLQGVDLLAGDRSLATLRILEDTVALRALLPGQKGAPLTLPIDGLGEATLTFSSTPDATQQQQQERYLSGVRIAPLRVPEGLEGDAEATARVTGVRAQVYPPLDVPLLPDLGGGGAADGGVEGLAPMSQAAWSSLVCESVRAAAEADTVYLRELPPIPEVPGPRSALQVMDQLALLDRVQVHAVPGTAYGNLLNKASGLPGLIQCGARTSSDKARGRVIEATRTYRVATTDRTAATHPVGGLLAGVRPTRALDGPGVTPLRDAAGQPATLRAAVLRHLGEVRDSGGGVEAIAPWWAAAPGHMPPMWLLRVRQLSFQASRFQGTEDPAFEAVPETLATSPSSLTLGAAADVALDHSSPTVAADLRLRGAFTSLRIDEETDATESADDLRLSTSLTVPAWTVSLLAEPLRVGPYTEMLFDSELTPTEAEDGSLNPRQADLSLALGLSAPPSSWLVALRLAGFASRDLAQIQTKPTEYGGKLEWATAWKVSPALTWSTLGDLQLYADTPDDDPSDLRFRGLAETRISLPLARWLSIDLYAQGFALQGRHPDNDTLGLSYTLGSALDLIGALEL